MPSRDLYHDAVRNALIKDGWVISHDPFVVQYEDLRVFIDLGVEKGIIVTNSSQNLAIEIKVFGGGSFVAELERAIGQYSLYRSLPRRVFGSVSDCI